MKKIFFPVVLFVFLEFLVFCHSQEVSCLSPAGHKVDWYILYKNPNPKQRRSAEFHRTGKEFYYMDSNNSTFLFKNKDIQGKSLNPLYRTINQIYTKKTKIFGMYNDQPPINTINKKKPSDYGHTKDLYEDLVAKSLGDRLSVETWHSQYYCTKHVDDIEEIKHDDGFTFPSSEDHSKWAVTKNLNWTCIGDINRYDKQFERGGLTLCIDHVIVAHQLRGLISKLRNCEGKSGRRTPTSPTKTCR
ncbi:plancitoxin-1-like [Saccostrea cucullata]|uniref:plancitoxin-1-like n=1 Tax=Saccostrea cuccullata TaxID=36930 RepID=UPI002ED0E048